MALSSEESMGSSALRFSKLNSSNYRSWAFNMRLYLESMDLFEFADGSAVPPAADATEAVRRTFANRAKKAWTYICLAVEPEQQIHIRDTTTANAAWNTLKSQFVRISILQKVRLRQQYYSSRFETGGNMLEHLNHMKSLHDQLREMGCTMDDKELAMTVLASLPSEFKPLLTALDAVGEANLSFEKVKGMLLNDFDRQVDSIGPEDAFSAKRSQFHRRGKQGSTSFVSKKSNSKQEKIFRGVCHSCHERGHFARDCPKRNGKGKDNSTLPHNPVNSKMSAHCVDAKENQHDPTLVHEEALTTSDQATDDGWIIDSGASQHMTFDRDALEDFVEFKNHAIINLSDNRQILAYGKGTYRTIADLGDGIQHIALKDVLFVPDLEKNLLSVRAMTKLGAFVNFEGDQCRIIRSSKILATGKIQGRLYKLNTIPTESVNTVSKEPNTESSLELWHYRFGHLGMDNVKKLKHDNLVDGMQIQLKKAELCEPCIMGKHHRSAYPKGTAKRATEPFEIIHSDVCGPMSVKSLGGSSYFVSFIDDFSRFTKVYFIMQKSEVLVKFKEFVNFVKNQFGKTVKVLRSDNGGEYKSRLFADYLKEEGVIHQTTVPENPAQNGTAERMNRTIVETARSMMCHAKVPQKFWAEAVNTAVYLRNRSPTTSLNGTTPYESWYGVKPDVSNLKVFGCVAFVHVEKNKRRKFDPKSCKTMFVGYPNGTKGYKLFNLSSGSFIRSRDVIFAEKTFHDFTAEAKQKVNLFFPDTWQPEDSTENKMLNGDNVNLGEQADNQPVGETFEDQFMRQVAELAPHRNRRPPRRMIEECYTTSLTADIDEPVDINEAWNGQFEMQWKEATDAEYESLISNHTWDLVPLPKNQNVVGNRWVFKVKRNPDGSVDRFKARLVAQGYSQSEGIDYEEVFSPVVRFTSIRLLLALATVNDWHVHQMDVKTAFLQGTLDSEIYMKQPAGYVSKDKPNHVCKLRQSIYGLKQAARCWNNEIDNYLKSIDYCKSDADTCIYIKSVRDEEGKVFFVILALWVDDILLFSNNAEMLMKEKEQLGMRFVVTDQGEVHHILGMVVKRDRANKTMKISQQKFLEGILKKFKMENCKPVTTPAEPGRKFMKLAEDEIPVDVQLYQQIIGSLTYAATATRPDIAAAVNMLSKFMTRPGKDHMEGAKRILRYIKGTIDYGLSYNASDSDCILIGYSDSDWAGDVETRHSTSGYVFKVYGNTVSWRSKKQNTVAKSTTEAEYVALSHATQEAIWLRRLLKDIREILDNASTIFEDNCGAIELSKNPRFHERTKHIDVSYHFVREQVKLNNIIVKYCPTQEMLADVMTKGLAKDTFQKFRDKLDVKELC